MAENGFTQTVTFIPSRDWRRPEPERDYGVTTMLIRFVLKGPLGAVQWLIGTDYAIKPVRQHLQKFDAGGYNRRQPEGWDLGYHSPKPMYDDQTSRGMCDVLDCDCYYDGSALHADLLIEGFLARGDDWVWQQLRDYYDHTFCGAPWPQFEFTYLPHPEDEKANEATNG